MHIERITVHTMTTPNGVKVQYARILHQHGGLSVLLHRLTPEQRRRAVVINDKIGKGMPTISKSDRIIAHLDKSNPMDYSCRMRTTIVELPEFMKRAADLLSEAERLELIDYLASYPRSGDLMQGTGGIRKLRWGRGVRGKSGGVRVIYYYHDERIPLYLLTLFGKNEQANLSKAERNELAKLVDVLIRTSFGGSHG